MQVEPNEEDDVPESGDGTVDGTYGYILPHSTVFGFYLRFSFCLYFSILMY